MTYIAGEHVRQQHFEGGGEGGGQASSALTKDGRSGTLSPGPFYGIHVGITFDQQQPLCTASRDPTLPGVPSRAGSGLVGGRDGDCGPIARPHGMAYRTL